jgi:polyisoprenoid-binding protein YceI
MAQPSRFRSLRALTTSAFAVVALTLSAAVAPAAPIVLELDNSHTNVGFTVRHFVTKVHGEFKTAKGTIELDQADYSKSKVDVTIEAASINTNHERRDNHLRSEDFFDVEKNPTITFVSKSIAIGKDGKGKMTGDLTMRGVTKPVTLDVEVTGVQSMGERGTIAGFTATGQLNRKDYNILWNRTLDQGGTMLSDEVDLRIDVEAKTPQPKPAATAAAPAAGDKAAPTSPAPAAPAASGDKK